MRHADAVVASLTERGGDVISNVMTLSLIDLQIKFRTGLHFVIFRLVHLDIPNRIYADRWINKLLFILTFPFRQRG